MTDNRDTNLMITGLIGAALRGDSDGIRTLRPTTKAGLTAALDRSISLTASLLILGAEHEGCTPQELLDNIIHTFVMGDPEEGQ